jgi:hypothetical protein
LKDPGINGRNILKWVSKQWEGVDWIEFAQSNVTRLCRHSNNFEVSVNLWMFVDWLHGGSVMSLDFGGVEVCRCLWLEVWGGLEKQDTIKNVQ